MGHYYSYIMDRETGNWFEFNDSKVTPFDVWNLDKEAFGKNEVNWKSNFQVTRNAYVLIYEWDYIREDGLKDDSGELSPLNLTKEILQKCKLPLLTSDQIYPPPYVKQEVERSNFDYWI